MHFKKGETSLNSLTTTNRSETYLSSGRSQRSASDVKPGATQLATVRVTSNVKCTQQHEPGKCARTTREGKPKCVNCDGDHAANHHRCPAYKAYEARIVSRAPAPQRSFISKPHIWNNFKHREDFPPLQDEDAIEVDEQESEEQVSFTQKPSTSSNSRSRSSKQNSSSFASAQGRFMAIPDIDITVALFNKFIDELAATLLQHERMQIMMRYCMPSATQNLLFIKT